METTQETGLTIGKIETPKQFSQLGVLVLDGSGSMTDPAVGNISKAQAVNNSTRELFTRFKASRVAKNFAFSVIAFDGTPTVRMGPTEVGPSLDDNGDYNPLNGHGGGTRIDKALEMAETIVNDFLAAAPVSGVPHSAIILLMSDGCCGQPAKTKDVVLRVKNGANGSRIKVCTALFASIGNKDVAGESLLKEIASDPIMGYKTVYDGETLRAFFEKSISAASGGVRIV